MIDPAEDHGPAHFADSYRDVIALVDAVRTGDSAGARSIKDFTSCRDCLIEGLASVAARLGDRSATKRAAQERLDSLCEEVEWDRIDLGLP